MTLKEQSVKALRNLCFLSSKQKDIIKISNVGCSRILTDDESRKKESGFRIFFSLSHNNFYLRKVYGINCMVFDFNFEVVFFSSFP